MQQVDFRSSETLSIVFNDIKKSKFEECLIKNADAIYDRIKLDESLEILNNKFQVQLNSFREESQIVQMYDIAYVNINNWNIKIDIGVTPGSGFGEEYGCFNLWAKKEALEIVKTYIEDTFKDKIQEIKIEDDLIHILWKEGVVQSSEEAAVTNYYSKDKLKFIDLK